MDLKTFLENFEAIAEAPGGIPKLRSLILDLAVRGKLVPQYSEDDPAFTEQKSVIEIDIQDLPELPKNWILSTVNNACSHIVDCPHSTAKFVDKGFYCIDTNSMSQGQILFEKARYVTEETFIQRTKRLLPEEGDILFSREGTIGISAIVPKNIKLCLGQRMMMYRVHHFLDSFYFLYFLASPFFKKQLELKITGTAAKHVNIGDIRKMVVIVPPLAEQKRIVAKVDELMGLCDRYEAAKQTRDNLRQKLRGSAIASLMNAETDEELDAAWAFVRDNWCELSQHPEDVSDLRKSVLQLAIRGMLVPQNPDDEPVTVQLDEIKAKKVAQNIKFSPIELGRNEFNIPNTWKWIKLGSILQSLRYGTSKKCDYDLSGIPVLRIPNVDVDNGKVDTNDLKFANFSDGELKELGLLKDDLLMIRSNGSASLVGRTAVVEDCVSGYAYAGYLVRLRIFSKHSYSRYLNLALNTFFVRQQIEVPIRTTSGVKNINSTEIANILLPLPPLAEQKRIVAKVDELMKLCDQLEASLRLSQQRAENLAASAISHLTI